MESVYILRTSQSWASGQVDTSCQFMESLWNSTFNVSFKGFRKFVNKLHIESVDKIPFTHRFCSFDPKLEALLLVPGIQAFPSDDDDWFHPHLLDIVEPNLKKPFKAHWWKYCVTELGKAFMFDRTNYLQRSKYTFQSNNFCIQTPCAWEPELGHCFIDNHLAGHPLSRYIDIAVSVHNRHLASQSLWWNFNIKSQEDLIHCYEQCQADPPRVLPSVFDSYIERMLDFYRNRLRVCTNRRLF